MSVFSFFTKQKPAEEKALLSDEVRQAWENWQNALSYFNNVTDPDLVECAIHNIESTRKHYMYLLKHVKEEKGVSAPRQPSSIRPLRSLKNRPYRERDLG